MSQLVEQTGELFRFTLDLGEPSAARAPASRPWLADWLAGTEDLVEAEQVAAEGVEQPLEGGRGGLLQTALVTADRPGRDPGGQRQLLPSVPSTSTKGAQGGTQKSERSHDVIVYQSLEPPPSRHGAREVRVRARNPRDPETARVLRRLADLVEDSDLRRYEIEDRAGFNKGYLSQLLWGNVELKVWHVHALLGALGRNPAEFFGALFPMPRPPMSAATATGLRVNADVVCIYSLGIEAVESLRARLDVCEQGLRRLLADGLLEHRKDGEQRSGGEP